MQRPSVGLQQRRCCWILGVIILWCSLCILRFSSLNSTQIVPLEIPPSLHPSPISNQALLITLDSASSKSFPKPSQNLIHHHTDSSSLDHINKYGKSSSQPNRLSLPSTSHPCSGKLIYIHRLPKMFNEDLLASCSHLNPWKSMCRAFSNGGLGPKLEAKQDNIISNEGWFATNQFALELIFYNRMKQYKCLTNDSSKAALVYVPFYAGLDISRYLWGGSVSERDNLSLALANWLKRQDEWSVMGGRDHFMVCGRMTWDFRRLTDAEADWGNKLLRLDVTQNMSNLLIEKSPWHHNDYAIPYPTYFHPHNYSEVLKWQDKLRRGGARLALFSFAGAPRETMDESIRGEVMEQCRYSSVCTLLECDKGESKCHSPVTLMKLFQESVFCLQPQGDSATRRSTFDSMVAGCIPVFFHPHSAYIQYIWHLPKNLSEYSVYIPHEDVKAGRANIESILKSISSSHVEYMRERVISLIPTLVYANPFYPPQFEDAFDVAIKALMNRVAQLRLEKKQFPATYHVN